MKRQICLLFLLVFLVCFWPAPVYANGPVPPQHLTCKIENQPNDAVFVDLFIEISPQDSQYTAYNVEHGQKFHIGIDSPVVQYNEDGFQSFTFHYEASASDFIMDESSPYVEFAYQNDQFQTLLDDYHRLKIALLDVNGEIIQLSDSVNLQPNRSGFFTGIITYDAARNTVDAPYYRSPFAFLAAIFTGIFVLFRMCLSSSIETLIAIPFKIEPLRYIFAINMATQVVLVIFMSFCTLPYLWTLMIIEVVVYCTEFGVFRLIYKGIPIHKLAMFVVLANTSSLLLGLLLNFVSSP